MSTNKPSSLRTEVFEGLVPALVDLVAAIHRDDEPVNVHKQSVCQAVRTSWDSHPSTYPQTDPQTNIFKQRMASAKEITDNLPGGEMSLSDQDEVIAMLKALRDQKRLVHHLPTACMFYSADTNT